MLKIVVLIVSVSSCLSGLENYRLSRDIIPVHYSLKIRPDFNSELFYGEVSIYVTIKTVSEKITVHSSNLSITEVYLNQRPAVYLEGNDDKLSIKYVKESIQPGDHVLSIKYNARLVEKNYGFIKAPFDYADEKVFMYITDMEPSSARKVFPCFDEPYFKAKFNIRLISPNNSYTAISNMPEIHRFSTALGTVYDFGTSVPMSTYLVSFAFTPLPFFEDQLEYEGQIWPIRIFTLNASQANNMFAAECTKKAIRYYSEYTNISYPLPKLDMIEYERNETAATENWGLITFRKGLLSPSLGIFYEAQIELVIFHEISHFWFGNLVTNDWWNDLWLQEAFANYMSYKLSAIENGWTQLKTMKSFQHDYFLEIEVKRDDNAVVSYVPQQEDVSKKFTNLVYDKGASILLMLENIIGEDKFKLIIQKFLKEHAYKTVTTNDVISTVEDMIPHMPMRAFMENFLYQTKFPLITVEERRNGTFVLRQKTCKISGDASKLERKWTVPITYLTDRMNKSKPKLVWFDKDMDQLEILEPESKWIVFNPNGIGMYKIKLGGHALATILENFPHFDQQTSSSLVSNALFLFKYNITSCDILIKFMENTRHNRKWVNFTEFYHHLVRSLACNNYDKEAVFFMNFVKRRFNETNYEKQPLVVNLCNKEIKEEIEIIDVRECAAWIGKNIPDTEENLVLQTIR